MTCFFQVRVEHIDFRDFSMSYTGWNWHKPRLHDIDITINIKNHIAYDMRQANFNLIQYMYRIYNIFNSCTCTVKF